MDMHLNGNGNGKVKTQLKALAFNAGVANDEHGSLDKLVERVDQLYTTDRTPTPTAITPGEVADLLRTAHQNDAGNADCMELLYGNQIRYDHTREIFLLWNQRIWKQDQTAEMHRLARKVAKARYQAGADMPTDTEERQAAKKRFSAFAITSESARQVEQMIKSVRALAALATTINDWDSDPFLANAGEVTLDLNAGTARENRQADYITKTLGTEYDATAQAPRWLQFLDEVFADDKELIAFVQRAIGYALTGDIREQVIFLLYGGGANGKSVLLSILNRLLGDYAGSTPFDTFDSETSEARQDLAKLHGTRLVTVIETEEDRRLAEARVKSVTGGDLVTARKLYSESFDYKPQFKLWIAMNHKPRIHGTDRGIWRRIKLIPFTQNFEGRADDTLETKLVAELPGILNWALEGLRAWHAQGLGSCRAVDQATEEYRQESDIIGQWLEDRTIAGEGMHISADAAYKDFAAWKGMVSKFENTTWFGRRMSERGHKSEKKGGKKVYLGLGLLAPVTA
jgi:putative DNA primase/helicase